MPDSTITPPIDVPWPQINFVAEWTIISAPYSMGLHRYGVGNVLSMISGIPASCAIFATASISRTLINGLPIVSANIAFVFLVIAFLKFSGSSGFTNLV